MPPAKWLPRMFQKKRGPSAPVPVDCSQAELTNGRGVLTAKPYNCRVVFLDDTELTLTIKVSGKGSMLLKLTYDHLNMVERAYFGLRYYDEYNQPHWLDPRKSIASQVPAAACYTFYFGVKFYASDPCKLFDELTRYQFFLQVKKDILEGRLPVNQDLAAELAAFAVQSELGDQDLSRFVSGYVSEFRFIPHQTEDFERRVALLHGRLKGQVPSRAEYQYLDRVKWLDMYGVDLYPTKVTGVFEGNLLFPDEAWSGDRVNDDGVECFLGISPTGVVVYKNKNKICSFYWPRLVKLSCKNKMFVIKVRDRNNVEIAHAFECVSKQACKHIWKCCIEHHSFFRTISASQSYQASSKLFAFGSRRSRTNSNSSMEDRDRAEPAFVRRPSVRHQRRISGSDSCPEDFSDKQRPMSTVHTAGHLNEYKKDGYSSGPELHQNSKMSRNNSHSKGLYTNPTTPQSVHSEIFPRRIYSGSESDATLCSRHCRSTYNPSDTEAHPSVQRRQLNQAMGATDILDSESEVGYAVRRRQCRDRSNETLTYMFESDCSNPRNNNLQSNRSLSSYATTSETRRRTRSRSATRRPPEELAQHFKYVDPSEAGLSEDQLKEIPYTHIETDSVILRMKYSPRTRHRLRQRRQKSCGELTSKIPSSWLPDGEAPPPYLEPPKQTERACCRLSAPSVNGSCCCRNQPSVRCYQQPMTVQKTETLVAPIVKTKVAATCFDSLRSSQGRSYPTVPMPRIGNNVSIHQPDEEAPVKTKTPETQWRRMQTSNTTPAFFPSSQTSQQQFVHGREDSGLEMDSPESSQTTGTTLDLPTAHTSTVCDRTSGGFVNRSSSTYVEEELFDRSVQQQLRNAAAAHYYQQTTSFARQPITSRVSVPATGRTIARPPQSSVYCSDGASSVKTYSHQMTDL